MGLMIRSVQGGSLLVVSEPSEESLISFLTPHEPVGLNSPKRDGEPCHHFLRGNEKKEYVSTRQHGFQDQLSLCLF